MMYDIYTKIGERSAEYKCRLNVTVKLRVRLTSIGFRSAALQHVQLGHCELIEEIIIGEDKVTLNIHLILIFFLT